MMIVAMAFAILSALLHVFIFYNGVNLLDLRAHPRNLQHE